MSSYQLFLLIFLFSLIPVFTQNV